MVGNKSTLCSVISNRPLLLAFTGAVILPGLAAAQPVPAGSTDFHRVWERTDYPVAAGRVARSWVWGPGPNHTLTEPNRESPGGQRQVEYYDKSRMEIIDPRLDPASQWFVTNGLLVSEMVSGRMQLGASTFEQRAPARIPVAGDSIETGPGAIAPSYAALARVATLSSDENRVESRVGRPVTATLSADGTVGSIAPDPLKGIDYLRYYEPVTGHNIPTRFWDFMHEQGPVYEDGKFRDALLFDWVYTMGYPITEPYWIDIKIKNKPVRVMVQAFQRRILTYNPENQAGWQVEMGNVGMQYYEWRYGTGGPGPSPTATPVPVPGARQLMTRTLGLPDILKTRQYAGIHQSLYTVVTGQTAWEELWARYTAELESKPPAPAVEFDKEFVAAAFWGDKPNGCYRLDIKSVQVQGDRLTVTVDQAVKQGGCATVIVQPNDLQAVSRDGQSAGKYTVAFVDTGGNTLQTGAATLP